MISTTLFPSAAERVTTERFYGLDRRSGAADGFWSECTNMSSRLFPLAAQRPRRAVQAVLNAPGGLIGKDALGWIENGTLYFAGLPTGLRGITPGEKQLVSMGAYIVIFPDKLYYNTADPTDYGSLEAEYVSTGAVTLAPCDADGAEITPLPSAVRPESADNGVYWADSSERKMYRYSAAAGQWAELPSCYTRVGFTSLGTLGTVLSAGDGVTVSGIADEGLVGEKLIHALGGGASESDYAVLTGFCSAPRTFFNAVRIKRSVPDMDFVCQSGNRLWGCFYGRSGGRTVNELYCCALGDFKNWRRFEGLAGDSWAASVGADGPWTGAVNYLGTPVFFKERSLHRIEPSPGGAHRVTELVCRGVQRGSAKSLCVVGETLFYKSRRDICVWEGGFPESVSATLGDEEFTDACAGTAGGRYYISMRGRQGFRLFVYDAALGVWCAEDALEARDFAAVGGELWCLDAAGRLISMFGSAGTPEVPVPWSFTSTIMHYGTAEEKYVGRICLRMSLESGARATAEIEYDSSGVWQSAGEVTGSGVTRSFLLPIVPRRCDHMRLRLSGTGEVRVYSISRMVEAGSDVPEGGA